MRLVIVGNGMAGARLVEELRAREPDPDRLRITVIGAEPEPAYNRVLLAGVLAGGLTERQTHLYPPGWFGRNHVTVHQGRPAVALDPGGRRVTLADGRRISADAVVLATGSRAVLPAIPGLAGGPGVAVLRTLADCRRIVSLVKGGPVTVLGGGVLGLETARALATRGLSVTVLHPTGHLMNRQLDPEAGGVLAGTLRRLGVRLALGSAATGWHPGRGLTTDTGDLIECRAVVVSAGAVPDTALAAAAGLTVGDRSVKRHADSVGVSLHRTGGVAVDDGLATSADGVYAIGDCAQHPGATAGFVQPAWEQAAVLADLLTGADPAARYRGTRAVTRLKDTSIHLTAIGYRGADAPDDEILRFSDPARGRYAKLVVRDDRVAAAIMLGVPDAAATVAHLFDSGTPVPADRLGVLLGRAGGPPAAGLSPDALPDTATVCRCNSVNKGQIVAAYRAGATDVATLSVATRATTGCGGCTDIVAGLCDWLRETSGHRTDTEEVVA